MQSNAEKFCNPAGSAKQTPATTNNYGCWLRNGELSEKMVPHCFL
jgi:hypothetical protein